MRGIYAWHVHIFIALVNPPGHAMHGFLSYSLCLLRVSQYWVCCHINKHLPVSLDKPESMPACRYDYVRSRIPRDTERTAAWYDVPLLRTLLLDHKYGYVFKLDGGVPASSPHSLECMAVCLAASAGAHA